MNRLNHIYDRVNNQITHTQKTLNSLYRRAELIEQLIMEHHHTSLQNSAPYTSYVPSTYTPNTPNTSYTHSDVLPTSIPIFNNINMNPSSTTIRSRPSSRRLPRNATSIPQRPIHSSLGSSVHDEYTLGRVVITGGGGNTDTNTTISVDNIGLGSSLLESVLGALTNALNEHIPSTDSHTIRGLTEDEIGRHIRIGLPTHILTMSGCPITMEIFTPDTNIMTINTCGHSFSEIGLRPWLISHNVCPICRARIIP
jgi:hypothetical protein